MPWPFLRHRSKSHASRLPVDAKIAATLSCLLFLATVLGLAAGPKPASAASANKFTVYYSLKFTQPVSGFDQCGLVPMPIIYQGALFKKSVLGSLPDYNQIKKVGAPTVQTAVAATTHKMAVLDVEGSWALSPNDSDGVMAGKAADYYDLLSFLKTELKARGVSAKLGYFEVAPPSFYQSPSANGQPKTPYERAVTALDVVARNSDVLFPQLYGYLNPEHFKKYTTGTVGTARARWPNKPVYPFIWMQRRADPVVPGGPYVNEMVPKGALRIQLDTVKASGANGVVIWGTLGNTQARLDWDPKADWWLETKAFMKKQGADLSKCKL